MRNDPFDKTRDHAEQSRTHEKFIYFLSLFFLIFIFFARPTFAESNYVLPYPDSMPGSRFYKLSLILENVSKYWYFGDFGRFKYNLRLADKYLVEAETLLEYKQYFLGYKALQKSDFYFSKILPNLIKAEKKNKKIVQKRLILRDAAKKHIETIELLKANTPDVFNWQPEEGLPTTLFFKKNFNNSIFLREKNL